MAVPGDYKQHIRYAFVFGIIFTLFLILSLILSNDTLDDHWITYRYARNLARGDGLVWNVGEPPVEGYTCFLWVVINALFIKLGISPLLGSRLVSLAASVGMIVATFSPANTVLTSLRSRAALALLIVLCPVLVFYGQSGMETLFFTALVFLGTLCWCRSRAEVSRVRSLASTSVLYGLAALTRPEGYILFLLVLLMEGIYASKSFRGREERQETRQNFLVFLSPFLVIFSIYFVWRYAYYGFLFPNSYYAKHSGGRLANLPLGVLYLFLAFGSYLAVPVTLLVSLLMRETTSERWRGLILPLTTIPIAFLAFLLWMGGDDRSAFPSVRLLSPFLPILYLVLILALQEVLRSAPFWKQVGVYGAVVVLCLFACVKDGLSLAKRSNPEWASTLSLRALVPLLTGKLHRLDRQNPDALSAWIVQHSRPEDLIAVPWAGRVPYYTDRPTIDMLGLNDVHTAHLPSEQRGIGVKMDPDYILQRKPALIFVNVEASYWHGRASFEEAGGWIRGDRRLLALLRATKDYEFIENAPRSICAFRRCH